MEPTLYERTRIRRPCPPHTYACGAQEKQSKYIPAQAIPLSDLARIGSQKRRFISPVSAMQLCGTYLCNSISLVLAPPDFPIVKHRRARHLGKAAPSRSAQFGALVCTSTLAAPQGEDERLRSPGSSGRLETGANVLGGEYAPVFSFLAPAAHPISSSSVPFPLHIQSCA